VFSYGVEEDNFEKKNNEDLMQFKLFVVAVTDAGEALNELNGFLRSHRVLEESHELIAGKNGSAWHFCVKYLEVIKSTGYRQTKRTIPKIDYKEVLNDKTFAIFSKLREYRKEIAREDAIPAFAVFTDKELAEIAKLPDINESGMKTINGIGEKRTDRYGKKLVEMLQKQSKPPEVNKD